LNTGPDHTCGLGFINRGGTLNVGGMLFVNRCSWAHIVSEAARLLSVSHEQLLTAKEIAALDGKLSPEGTIL
jgi:hypothetical protein